MGRVSRHKKVKSIDPFYRGPKKDVDKGWNLPPKKGGDSQTMSRSFRHFLAFSQIPSNDSKLEIKNATASKTDNLERPNKRLNKDDHKKTKKRKIQSKQETEEEEQEDDTSSIVSDHLEYKRNPGESSEHYLARVDYETNKRLLSAHKKVKTTSTKRKEYLKKRKLKLKLRKSGIRLDDVEGMDFNDLQDHVKFGEVAQAPPSIGPTKKKERRGLLLCDKLKTQQEMLKKQLPIGGLKKQQDIAQERDKIINLYRQMKKQKQNLSSDKK